MKPWRPSAISMLLLMQISARGVVHWLSGLVHMQFVVADSAVLRPYISYESGNRFQFVQGVVKCVPFSRQM